MVTVDDHYNGQHTLTHNGFSSTLEMAAMAQVATSSDTPKTVTQAMNCDDSEYWKAAIMDEITNQRSLSRVRTTNPSSTRYFVYVI